MRKADSTTKALLFALTIGVFGLLVRPSVGGTQAAAVEGSGRSKQYVWGASNFDTALAGNVLEGDWFGTSDETANRKGWGYQLDLAQVAQLVARQARKGWSVHTIGAINSGYYVLFEK